MNATLHPAWLGFPETGVLIHAFSKQPGSLRFVGGAVRDALLGRSVTDIDAATTLMPDEVIVLLENNHIRAIPTGIKHGTITAQIGNKQFEITTLRKDTACDGRHAHVEFTQNWQHDARRRDFTMNALYLSPEGELFDYFGGADDARAGIVRFIGLPADRIREDYLRILRFFRFHAWFGSGDADKAALDACYAEASNLSLLSGERIQHELLRLLAAARAEATLHLIMPIMLQLLGFDVMQNHMIGRLHAIESNLIIAFEPHLRLAALLLNAKIQVDEALRMLVQRLRLSNQHADSLKTLLDYVYTVSPHLNDREQKMLLRNLGARDFENVLAVSWAYGDEVISKSHPYGAMLTLATRWIPPVFPVAGDDLIALGISPGKTMGKILKTLEAAWEDADYALSKDQLLAQLD